MKGDAPPLTPGFLLETMKYHGIPRWLTTEDLTAPENRVTIHNTTPLSVEVQQPGLPGAHPSGDTGLPNESEPVSVAAPMRIQLSYTPNNVESFARLKDRWVDVLKKAGHAATSLPLHALLQEANPNRRRWPSEWHMPNGYRSTFERPRHEMQGALPRQSMRSGRFVFCLRISRESFAYRDCKRDSGGGAYRKGTLQLI
jgi:hypothetical protein